MINGVMMKQAVYALNDSMKQMGRGVHAEEKEAKMVHKTQA